MNVNSIADNTSGSRFYPSPRRRILRVYFVDLNFYSGHRLSANNDYLIVLTFPFSPKVIVMAWNRSYQYVQTFSFSDGV